VRILNLNLASVWLLALSTSAQSGYLSQEWLPGAAKSVVLGDYYGTAYYEVEQGPGLPYRLVVTMVEGYATPIRIVATLVTGERIQVSVPRKPGETACEVDFFRMGGRMIASRSALIRDC
jgi:hypothetical protein